MGLVGVKSKDLFEVVSRTESLLSGVGEWVFNEDDDWGRSIANVRDRED